MGITQSTTGTSVLSAVVGIYMIFLILRWRAGGDFSDITMDGNRLLLTRANCIACTKREYFVPRTQITGIHLGRAIPFMEIVCALIILLAWISGSFEYGDSGDFALAVLAALSIRIVWKINIIELEVLTPSTAYRSKRVCGAQTVEVLTRWLFEDSNASLVPVYSASVTPVPTLQYQPQQASSPQGGQMMQQLQPMQGGQMMQQPVQTYSNTIPMDNLAPGQRYALQPRMGRNEASEEAFPDA